MGRRPGKRICELDLGDACVAVQSASATGLHESVRAVGTGGADIGLGHLQHQALSVTADRKVSDRVEQLVGTPSAACLGGDVHPDDVCVAVLGLQTGRDANQGLIIIDGQVAGCSSEPLFPQVGFEARFGLVLRRVRVRLFTQHAQPDIADGLPVLRLGEPDY